MENKRNTSSNTIKYLTRLRRWLLCALACIALLAARRGLCDIELRFIDVGQGDACLIICDGESMLVDGGEPSQSNKLYSILHRLNITRLKYAVNTHPHSDHLGGMNGALTAVESVEGVFSCVDEYEGRTFEAYVRLAGERGCALGTLRAGDELALGSARVYVLAPETLVLNMNDNSIVLRIVYGERAFLITGDMSVDEETTLLASGAELRSDVLKVGHHGASTASSQPFLEAVRPACAVISVGVDNGYGHPHEATLYRLQGVGAQIFRTDLDGDIIVRSDGQSLSVETDPSHGAGHQPATPEELPDEYYVGNVKSLKFHTPDCASLPAEHNRIIFYTREEALAAGYTPCGGCRP